MMDKVNLFWAIIWAIVGIVNIVGVFWNWACIIGAVICLMMSGMFWADYKKNK